VVNDYKAGGHALIITTPRKSDRLLVTNRFIPGKTKDRAARAVALAGKLRVRPPLA
jgi:hypothetical protein